MKYLSAGLMCLFVVSASAAETIRFWNLASETVTSIRLARSGTGDFGTDLAKIDADGEVDHDERLAIKNLSPGLYDASITFKSGRACLVNKINIEAGSIFSVEEKDLVSCRK
ncbi:hypothetical protein [Methylocystis echinoides]|nr:hypothetical protein [Methylocystis echinoides]